MLKILNTRCKRSPKIKVDRIVWYFTPTSASLSPSVCDQKRLNWLNPFQDQARVGSHKYQLFSTQIRVWRIFGYSNIFEYFLIRIFVRIIFVSFFLYKYIRIFVRIAFLIRIYSDIRSYHFFDTNIFGYSFVSFFGYKYIRIFVRIENLYSPHPDSNIARIAKAVTCKHLLYSHWFVGLSY